MSPAGRGHGAPGLSLLAGVALLAGLSLVAGLCFLSCAAPGAADRTDIGSVQGAGHESPRQGEVVTVEGVVVAEGADRERPMCWIEGEDDGDPATSRGLFVLDAGAPVGREVRVTGTVRELGGGKELSVTALVAHDLEVLGTASTPAPIVVSLTAPADDGVRRPPDEVIDDDGMARFEPAEDGLDFWESLEGMRVRLPEPVVVGPTHRGSFYVAPAGAGPRTVLGGLRQTEDDVNPERILVIGRRLEGRMPELAVGDGFQAPIDGVVHYRDGHYQLLPAHLPRPAPAERKARQVVPPQAADPTTLRVASANVLNLSPRNPPGKFAALARQIVGELGSPDLVALQEVQDDSGPADDGTVSAEATLAQLVRAVAAAGGPSYRWLQIDPRDRADGGQPGGNIRVAFLYDPTRLEPLDHRRLEDPAFSRDDTRRWDASRKPLVARFRDRRSGALFHVANLHLSSKGGDDRLWGARQPPQRPSEAQRVAQAEAVAEWVRRILDDDAGARIIVLGDLNEYPWRTPVRRLEAAGLVNLISRVPAEERYTYIYRGNSMVLDHVLVSPVLAPGASLRVLHTNTHLPLSRQVSDHDPLVATLPGI